MPVIVRLSAGSMEWGILTVWHYAWHWPMLITDVRLAFLSRFCPSKKVMSASFTFIAHPSTNHLISAYIRPWRSAARASPARCPFASLTWAVQYLSHRSDRYQDIAPTLMSRCSLFYRHCQSSLMLPTSMHREECCWILWLSFFCSSNLVSTMTMCCEMVLAIDNEPFTPCIDGEPSLLYFPYWFPLCKFRRLLSVLCYRKVLLNSVRRHQNFNRVCTTHLEAVAEQTVIDYFRMVIRRSPTYPKVDL